MGEPTARNPELSAPGLSLPVAASALVTQPQGAITAELLVPRMITDVKSSKALLAELQDFVHEVMVEGEDFGHIPGIPKKILLKPGAEKLLEVYGYWPQLIMVPPTFHAGKVIGGTVEDWNGDIMGFGHPFFNYQFQALIMSKRTGGIVGMGVGSCNSMESKYRWRLARRKCPKCAQETILKSKFDPPRWYCNQNKGGCNATFKLDDHAIIGQELGRVLNDDWYTLTNTLLKLSKKRALVDGAISVTRSSALFQEEEDEDDDGPNDATKARGSAAPSSSPAGDGRIEVTARGHKFWTFGVTGATLESLWATAERFDKVHGSGKAVETMRGHSKKQRDIDLTEAEGKAVVGHLEAQLAAGASSAPISAPTALGSDPGY